ncbi:MotB family protein [Marinimicrobium agarilyticum]|uniref:MotB family protein n=1 Tax=Marinimicrobium agarilyticum TaxID=306546 RepID=UPI0003FF12DA|nr:MotB family protein [Marinimicrobium agarilyticum]
MDDEAPRKKKGSVGLPAWMATFADLMALLLCFFVLLLSFSEMDAMKFKRLAGSLAQAFGVQAELQVNEVPKGTSVIAREFSPGKPEPTPINEIFQSTEDQTQMSLEVYCAEEFDIQQGDPEYDDSARQQLQQRLEELVKETEQDAMALARRLQPQISAGQIEIETQGRQIIIRIREQGSFRSGSAELAEDYYDVLDEIQAVLMLQSGGIKVQGHTDDIPINSPRFRSNWELSAARAVSVAHRLMEGDYIDEDRFQVTGFADTRPLAPNDSAANRARNRRVEVVIQQGLDDELDEQEQELLEEEGGNILRDMDITPEYMFDLEPEEIF